MQQCNYKILNNTSQTLVHNYQYIAIDENYRTNSDWTQIGQKFHKYFRLRLLLLYISESIQTLLFSNQINILQYSSPEHSPPIEASACWTRRNLTGDIHYYRQAAGEEPGPGRPICIRILKVRMRNSKQGISIMCKNFLVAVLNENVIP